MGNLICIYCGQPARQRDGVPVCDPHCTDDAPPFPWRSIGLTSLSTLALLVALMLGELVIAFFLLAALVLGVRSLVRYALLPACQWCGGPHELDECTDFAERPTLDELAGGRK